MFEETILKDVAFGPTNFGLDDPEGRARKALNTFGIEENRFNKNPYNCSGGQMRKIAIAGIIASDPEILILDEPTVGLDPLAKEDFIRLLKSSRFPWSIANLNKMFSLAKTDEHKAEFQRCFLTYMLSGILDVNGKKDLRKQAYEWAKTMSFLPWMLAKETGQSEKVVTLLDDFCEEEHLWKFSESVKS